MPTVAFQPNPIAPFQFQAVLDGLTHNVVVTWNVFGQRWYINIYTVDGVLVLARSMIGSPPPRPLAALPPAPADLINLVWSFGQVTATAVAPHGYTIGDVVELTIAGADPSGYDGTFECTITSALQFTYFLADDPGAIVRPRPNLAIGPYNTAPYDVVTYDGATAPPIIAGTYTPVVGGPDNPTGEALRWDAGTVYATTPDLIPYRPGTVVPLTISGSNLPTQNGTFDCLVLDANTFSYDLPQDPHLDAPQGSSPASPAAVYSRDLSLTAPYFASTLVWRPSSGLFEVNP